SPCSLRPASSTASSMTGQRRSSCSSSSRRRRRTIEDGSPTAHRRACGATDPKPPLMADAAPIRVALMITCLGDMLYPDVGVAIVRLLRKLGVVVEFPPGQTCCGLPLFNSGYHGEAAGLARRLVEIFRDAPYVVVPSGSCAWMVKHEVPGLLKDTPVAEDARRLAAKTYEFSQFLVRV